MWLRHLNSIIGLDFSVSALLGTENRNANSDGSEESTLAGSDESTLQEWNLAVGWLHKPPR